MSTYTADWKDSRNWLLIILAPIIVTIFSAMSFDNGTVRVFIMAIIMIFLHVYLGPSWFTRKVAWIAYFACWLVIAGPIVQLTKIWYVGKFPMTTAFSARGWKGLDLKQARLVNAPLVEMDQRIENQLVREEQQLALRNYSSASHMARARKEFDEYRAKVVSDMQTKATEGKKEAAKTSASATPAPVAQPAPQVAASTTAHYGEPNRNNVRIIADTTATPIPPGIGQTTPCWYKARGNGKRLQYWADNHNFTIVTADGSRYYAWRKNSMDLWNSRVLDVPYYLINESDQAVNATAKFETV